MTNANTCRCSFNRDACNLRGARGLVRWCDAAGLAALRAAAPQLSAEERHARWRAGIAADHGRTMGRGR